MYKIASKKILNPWVVQLLVEAPLVASKAKPGQFIILRVDEDGERIPLGQAYVEVIHTPGHTAGSVCYRAGDELLTGDTLFADSFGRYDLYSGDLNTLKGSLRRLAALDPTLTIFPGHGHSVPLGTACDTVCRILHL